VRSRKVHVIAGPNGSGKTTFAIRFLPEYAKCPNFVNADLIAQGLAPFGPESAAIKAGKLVLEQIREFARRGVDFGFETTLAGKTYVKMFSWLKEQGYRIHLYFLWIPTGELAIARIRERVLEGGHNVSAEDVRRRYRRGLSNFFNVYEPMLDSWMLFDNSEAEPILVAQRSNGELEVFDEALFGFIRKSAG